MASPRSKTSKKLPKQLDSSKQIHSEEKEKSQQITSQSDTNDLPEDTSRELSKTSAKILIYLIENPLATIREIAREVGLSPTTVQIHKRKPEFIKHYRKILGTYADRVEEAQVASLERMQLITKTSKKEESALRAAEILHIGIPTVMSKLAVGDSSPAQLPSLEEAKKQIKDDPCDVVDAEFEE